MQDAFLFILYYGPLKKMFQLHSRSEKNNATYQCSFDPFSFSSSSVEVTDLKKSSILQFFIPKQSPTKGMQCCVECGTCSTYGQNSFLFFVVHFHSIMLCLIEISKQTSWVTDDRPIIEVWQPHSLSICVAKSSSDSSYKICRSSEFFRKAWYIFYTISV